MPDYLVVVRVSDEDFDPESPFVTQEIDEVIGVFPIPKENQRFCDCPRDGKNDKALGIFTGAKYGWNTCRQCKRPVKRWHHIPFNFVFEQVDPTCRLWVQWNPEMSPINQDWRVARQRKRKRSE